jgi:hypothetical protein
MFVAVVAECGTCCSSYDKVMSTLAVKGNCKINQCFCHVNLMIYVVHSEARCSGNTAAHAGPELLLVTVTDQMS